MRKAKFAVILAIFLTAVSYESFSWFKRVEKNGRDNGPGREPTYSLVSEYRDKWGTSIWCEHPGSAVCPRTVAGEGREQDEKTQAEQICVDHAFNEMAGRNSQGNWLDLNTNHYVEWEKVGLNTKIKVTGPGENIPE